MTAVCKICGQLIAGPLVETGEAGAFTALQARLHEHINRYHQNAVAQCLPLFGRFQLWVWSHFFDDIAPATAVAAGRDRERDVFLAILNNPNPLQFRQTADANPTAPGQVL